GATKYSLAAAAACEYDPTFVRLNRTEHQAAIETVARKRKAAAASSAAAPGTTMPCPLVGPPPPAHATFLPVRRSLLYSPVVMSAVRIVLSSYADKTPGKFSDLLLARTLQIITLQLHGLQKDPVGQEVGRSSTSGAATGGGASAGDASGGVEETKSSGGGGSSSSNHEGAYFASVLQRRQEGSVGGGGGERNSLDASWVFTEGASVGGGGGGGGGTVISGSGGGGGGGVVVSSVCEALGRVANTHGALGTLFEDGLQWIVREFARRSPACRETLGRLGALPEDAVAAATASAVDGAAGGKGAAGGRGGEEVTGSAAV
ncbi:unnamed protein product, partial [Ectocarpus fasciculatus]